MALKSVRSILIIILILCMAFVPISNVHALSSQLHGNSLPLLDAFISQVKNGQAAELRGIYIPEILAARVVQQPMGNYEFVSPRQNIITQFDLAARVGSTGLLAHNYLAGESFSLLEEDQKFYLIYGDGQVSAFVVTEILRYQALEPANVLGDLKDLRNGDQLTAAAVFSKVYDRPGQVIFQTCIPKGNNISWGRLFVIAEPLSSDRHSEAE
jgi:hypothetical protein